MTSVEQWHYDFGIHSNIPKCCIVEWISNGFKDGEHDPWVRYFNYCRCKQCVADNKGITVYMCTSLCKKQHQRDYERIVGYKVW